MICIIIGLPTFFTGCRSSVTTFCPNYNVFNGYIYKTEVEKTTCSTTIGKTTTYTPCWYVYAYASNHKKYNESTNTCYYTVDSGDRNEKSAYNQAEKYYAGKHIAWYKRKTSNECFTGNQIEELWTTGVFFLSCAGLVFVIWLFQVLVELYETSKSKNLYGKDIAVYTPNFNEPNYDEV